MTPPRLLAIACSLLAATPALADPLALEGSYRFETTEKVDGWKPVCTETWTFTAPDRMVVTSGEEVVENRFRTETDRDGNWLVTHWIATNGKPDCMGGTTTTPPEQAERRISILRFNDGTMLVCPPPGHTDDGIPVHGNCYASLSKLD